MVPGKSSLIAPSPPSSAPAASGRFTAPQTAAPQIAPHAMRETSGPAFNRLGVKGSLSAVSPLIASSAIIREALAEIIAANGVLVRSIHLCFAAQAITAGAVIGRNP